MKRHLENFGYFLADMLIAVPMLSYLYRKESRRFLILLLVVPLIGIVISYLNGTWHWFARSGSVMVAISIVVSVASLLRERKANQYEEIKTKLGNENFSYHVVEDEESKEVDAEMADELADSERHVYVSHYVIGTVGAVLGTLIWGFGDLVGGIPT